MSISLLLLERGRAAQGSILHFTEWYRVRSFRWGDRYRRFCCMKVEVGAPHPKLLFRKENSFGLFSCKDLCMNFIDQVTDSMSDVLNVFFFCWAKEHKPSQNCQIVSKTRFSRLALVRSFCFDLRSLGGFILHQMLGMASGYHVESFS